MIVGALATNFHGVPQSDPRRGLRHPTAPGAFDALREQLAPPLRLDPQSRFEGVTGTTRHLVEAARHGFHGGTIRTDDDPHDLARFDGGSTCASSIGRRSSPRLKTPSSPSFDGHDRRAGRAKDVVDAATSSRCKATVSIGATSRAGAVNMGRSTSFRTSDDRFSHNGLELHSCERQPLQAGASANSASSARRLPRPCAASAGTSALLLHYADVMKSHTVVMAMVVAAVAAGGAVRLRAGVGQKPRRGPQPAAKPGVNPRAGGGECVQQTADWLSGTAEEGRVGAVGAEGDGRSGEDYGA